MNVYPKHFPTLSLTPGFWQKLAWLVLAAGILLRLAIWWQQRPILLDEANLIRNYVERSYGGLFQNLDYEQYAPPLFSVMVKACLDLFGNNELSARLFPLLCSIATLLLFYGLSLRFLNLPAATAALAFLAFGKIFIDYATQCKQYAADGLATLLLLELFFRIPPPNGFNRNTLLWSLIGAVITWFSMPSVFMLAGIGIYWLIKSWQTKSKTAFWGRIFAGCCWVASFAVYFLLLLQHNAQSDYLQNYHRDYFLAFPPQNIADLQLLGSQLGRIVSKAIGKTAIAKILTGLALAAILWQLVIRRKEARYQLILWLLIMPILFCFTASALKYYSLLARLTLFFMPLLILLVFLGLQSLAKNRLVSGINTILVLVVLGNSQELTAINKAFHSDFAEVRDGLKFIARQQQPGEVIIASDDVLPVVRYYTQHHQTPLRVQHMDLTKLGYGKPLTTKLDSLRRLGYQKVWIVASIHDPAFAEIPAQPERILKRVDHYFSYALLYKLQ
ncbi:glycosyltransferase family 39 protein [Adhaeribacter sp. BT258]|uniref:Glycosyltransferase family 39 protein n=1 Tax=Adhaeribacter terrigena TaxID=2793070 RepID=A0ABS1C3R6_9BACT|nr:glycosyltransferase family 39 protein [Adhaeribacter terrigena]MBK0404052.1 glycosyltransferase family 39 protein [Adhaeribacter terrigena]